MNRDPIEERGGPNVYGFVRNSVQDLFDNLGLWSALYRESSSPSWSIRSDEEDEPISDLTAMLAQGGLHLDPTEALGQGGWLRDPSGNAVDKVKKCRFYRGPNTLILTYGDLTNPTGSGVFDWYWRMRNHQDVKQFGKLLKTKAKFHVKDLYGGGSAGNQYSDIQNALKDKNVAAWGHGGHGRGGLPYYGGEPVPESEWGRAWIRNGGTSQHFGPSSFTGSYKLSYLMMWTCYGGMQSWGSLLAPGGSWWGMNRAIEPLKENPFYDESSQDAIWTPSL